MDISKIVPVLIGGLFMAAPQALADTRDEVIAGIERCGVIHDDRVWLDCVYGANQPMRARLGLQPAPEFQQRLVPSAQLSSAPPPAQLSSAPPPARVASRQPPPRKKPGFFENLLGNAPPAAVSRMRSYRYDKGGAFIVSLENGQEWRQTDVEGGTTSWNKSPAAYTVTIVQGAFGSYSLRTADSPHIFKVERVK
ncbi:MAG TPA: hypothetical protein VKB94_07330 [Rhizomicrobium sp.]|nr:hypothetical protein [Rhizomicrobium sp.]